jgi:hypothetical protein
LESGLNFEELKPFKIIFTILIKLALFFEKIAAFGEDSVLFKASNNDLR